MFTPDDPRPVSESLYRVLEGSVDLHCHSGPSPFPRRFDHVEASYDGARIGMRAMLVKSHHHNTVMDLLAMGPWLKDAPTPMYGGIALNSQVGGINPSAVAMSLKMGGRCVWGPTFSSAQHIAFHESGDGFPTSGLNMPEKEESIFDASGDVSADTRLVTQIVAEADALITGGHMDPVSIKALFETAKESGVRRLLVNHPDFIVNATEQDIEDFVALGAYIEHSIGMYDPKNKDISWPIQRLVDWIDRVGPERTTLGSDLGQIGNPLPVDGFIYVVEQLLEHGVPEKSVRRMIAGNTAFLLGLEDSPE
ncbi:MAG: hypothetical protein JWR01_21 [Subtercola sp.]|nr:hypothetical protein [Subtercola sp.]